MATGDESGRQWVVEPPPAAGEVSLYVAFGEGVELTGEQEAALGELLQSLEAGDADVVGYSTPACPSYGGSCNDVSTCVLKCGRNNCNLICVNLNKASTISSGGGWNLMGSFSARLDSA